MDDCDEKCKDCLFDPYLECILKNKKVWDIIYEPVYKKCMIKQLKDKNYNCDYIKNLRKLVKKHLK